MKLKSQLAADGRVNRLELHSPGELFCWRSQLLVRVVLARFWLVTRKERKKDQSEGTKERTTE